jgi:iron complex transport system ATP-binding protein
MEQKNPAGKSIQTDRLTTGFRNKKGLKKEILRDVNVTLRQGELVCLLGANGSGKSTLIRTLSGLHPGLSGHILIGGKDMETLTPEEISFSISTVLTEKPEVEGLSVFELVSMGRYPYTDWLGNLSAEDIGITQECLRVAGIDKLGDRQVFELSDGEKQKVMIARALAQKTDFIFLDEPTSYLDFASKAETIFLLKKISKEQHIGILFSSHDIYLVLQAIDRVWLAGDGTIQTGLPEDLILNGLFEKIFNKESIAFDMKTGKFLFSTPDRNKIALTGHPIAVSWTASALERNGFEVTTDKVEDSIEVTSVAGGYSWKLYRGTRLLADCHSIAGIFTALGIYK